MFCSQQKQRKAELHQVVISGLWSAVEEQKAIRKEKEIRETKR
jgi:hypothetical protein